MNFETREIRATCVVVGGGSAGYGAAMAAARDGCDVLLVERHGYLGGMGTAAGLGSWINYRHQERDLSESMYRELKYVLFEAGHGYPGDGGHVDIFEVEACKHLMEQTLLRHGGRVLYHALLRNVARAGNDWRLEFACKGATVAVRARFVIDATGDADTCALAGATMTHGRRSDGKAQPMSMIVQLGGFDPRAWASQTGGRLLRNRYAAGGDCFASEVARARAAGEWSIPRENIAMWWSMPDDPARVGVNGTRLLGYNACNPFDVTAAEIEGRRQAQELARFFRKYIPGFGHSYLLQTGPQVGVRESRRIVGRSTLEEADILACREPEDLVVRCAYPIDIHAPDSATTSFDRVSREFLYGVPYGCLLPAGLENIAAAGRCISATHEAAGSFRVMPTCMALGEAAGAAVALAVRHDCLLGDVSARAVRARLDEALENTTLSSPALAVA
ncbi:FAD-dependent pyridine nucleotide-disulfide oxidoreductase [Opitutaceae bacterium TAV5]|nr:FAD-dependent pyridine nucleotide-disulfide oxidoreductase [Opitutaceae bacterium TAV5]